METNNMILLENGKREKKTKQQHKMSSNCSK